MKINFKTIYNLSVYPSHVIKGGLPLASGSYTKNHWSPSSVTWYFSKPFSDKHPAPISNPNLDHQLELIRLYNRGFIASYPNLEKWIKDIKWELHLGWTSDGTRTGMPIKKLKIIRKEPGIYMLINTITKKKYIGQSSNLLERFQNYSSQKNLKKKHNSLICKALLRFGLSNFSVTILETGKDLNLSEREQYFINYFNPQYNIRKAVQKSTSIPKTPKNKGN